MVKACVDKLRLYGIGDADEYCFLFFCCLVPAPEEVSVASLVSPVANVDGADCRVGSDGSGVLLSLPDDSSQNIPPPPIAFKMASVSFGLLAQILLLR